MQKQIEDRTCYIIGKKRRMAESERNEDIHSLTYVKRFSETDFLY